MMTRTEAARSLRAILSRGPAAPFAASRAQHSPAWHAQFGTGKPCGVDHRGLLASGRGDVDFESVQSWSIDAPEVMPAGACFGIETWAGDRFVAPVTWSRDAWWL